MKLNIRDLPGWINWVKVRSAARIPLAIVIGVAVLVLVGQATSRSRNVSQPAVATKRVLVIGDSLTVGKFGEYLGEYLTTRFRRENLALYASCGSSPENWIRNGIHYETRCGYRELTVNRDFARDPGRHETPNIEELIAQFKPNIVIVQLGTNWMDRLTLRPSKETEIRAYLHDFVKIVLGDGRQLIWITPPDSSHYSKAVQEKVSQILWSASRDSPGFDVIDSRVGRRPMTHYQLGVTGGDGIHYRAKPARDWADQVIAALRERKV
jgi:hypothetical protein